MIKIKGGRKVLYQWDLNQSIILDNAFAGAQVHFSDEHNTKDTCLVLLAYEDDGQVFADIPNILLQKSGIIMVYIYTKEENEEHTEYFSELLVLPRKKPDDYVYTETEVKRWEDLEKKLTDGIGFYKPNVSADGNLSWAANNPVFPSVETVNIKGVKGDKGEPGKDAPQDVVRYAAQSLTDVQQAQARENIGAADAVTVNELKDDMPGKLSEPAEGLAVGKYFRVAAIDENGHAVLEAVDAKDVGVQDVQVAGASVVEGGVANVPIMKAHGGFGVAKIIPAYGVNILGEGQLSLMSASEYDVDTRISNYCCITPNRIDYAVKTAMCDGKGAPWTADEQAAARERMGIPGDYELIEEITLEEDVKSIKRATEPDGKAYNFKNILFDMEVPSGVAHANTYWFIKNGSTVLCYPNRPIVSKSMVTYFQCGAERKNGFLIGWNNAGNTQIGKDGGTALQYNLIALLTDLPITNIEIRAQDTFVSGEKFRIFGVRA